MSRLRAWLFRITPYRIAVVLGVVFTLGLLAKGGRLEQTPVVGQLENIFHDLKFRERGVRKPSGDVVIAAVDEKSIEQLGRWPFPRSDVARVVDKLTALGAKAIVFDVGYTDAAFEGQFAGAKKLRTRFGDISLANRAAEELLLQLAQAKTDATGAAVAAKELKDTTSAAHDVRTRLEPVGAAIEATYKALERYKLLHAEYDQVLQKELGARDPDQALADSVHQSGRVVLGSFLLSQGEVAQLSAEQLQRAADAVRHAALPAPYEPPVDPSTELLKAGVPQPVNVTRFAAPKSPLEILLANPASPTRTQVGFFNAEPDADGVIRREPMVLAALPSGQPVERALFLPGLSLAGVLAYYGTGPFDTALWTAGGKIESVAVLPGGARALGRTPTVGDHLLIPVDERGQLLLNYYGPDNTFPHISLADIWAGQVPRERIEGKIVLFGVTATGTYDQRVTPFDNMSPGVETHATAMENILHRDFLVRPWWAIGLECAILLGIALVVGRLLSRVSVVAGLPVTVATMGGYHLFDYALFRSGISVFSALPLFEVASIYLLQTVYRYSTEEAEKRQIRRAFQFYLNPSVIEEMLQDPSKLKLGGEKRVLTVMFSDIRGFTTISEKLPPEQLAKFINDYLTPMTNLVFEHGGTLDKYIGDAVMAIYGAPVPQEDHALRCCRTAVAMMRELQRMQERWRVEGLGYPPIDIGIGINSGPMVVGNMGAAQRFDYTVLGDNVNLASRLEGTNKDYRSRIIISQSTLDMCGGQVAARELGAVRVKGKREPVKIYELLDDAPAQGQLAEVIRRFDAGIAAFREQRWADARAQFESVLELRPDDGPAHAYLEVVDDYEKAPPGEGWDGVYTMTHK